MSLKALGSERDLYEAQWKGFKDPSFIEKTLSKHIDGPAANIRDRLLAGDVESLSRGERDTFATFLMLLLIRDPASIRPKQEPIETQFWEGIKGSPRTIDGVTRKMTDAEAKEVYDEVFKGYGGDLVFEAMIKYAHDSPHSRVLKKLQWRVFEMSTDDPDLVIADRPVQIWGQKDRLERLLIPLSPKAVFIAGTPEYFDNEIKLQSQFRGALAVDCIGEQFRQARRFVVARNLGPDDGLLEIAEWNLRMPDGSKPPQPKSEAHQDQ